MLSDRVELSSAEARVEGIVGGSVGVVELTHRTQVSRSEAHGIPASEVVCIND